MKSSTLRARIDRNYVIITDAEGLTGILFEAGESAGESLRSYANEQRRKAAVALKFAERAEDAIEALGPAAAFRGLR